MHVSKFRPFFLNRNEQSVSIACQKQPRKLFLSARFVVYPRNLFTVLYGRKIICYRQFYLRLWCLFSFDCSWRQLFSQDPDVEKELDEAEKQGQNGVIYRTLWVPFTVLTLEIAKEIENLRKEAQAFSAVRKALKHSENANGRSLPSTSIDPAQVIFEKV